MFFHYLDNTFLALKSSIKHFRHFCAKPGKCVRTIRTPNSSTVFGNTDFHLSGGVCSHPAQTRLWVSESGDPFQPLWADFKPMRVLALKGGWACLCQ